MGRPVLLSNGQMMVGLNEAGLVHDFYYPYVGLENLTTARSVHHKIGVWVDGSFSWIDGGEWDISVTFEADALISNVTMRHSSNGITIVSKDFVDSATNAFVRRFTIQNHTDHTKEIRLFLHQVFEISRSGRADTAFYEPDGTYLFDYKGRCALLIYGQNSDTQQPLDQYAVGNYGIEGKKGTFIDAEDGELSGNAVEHGGVDSVMRISATIAPHETAHVDYWIIASSSQYEALDVHTQFLKEGMDKREHVTRQSWAEWFANGTNALHLIPKEYVEATKKSLLVIKAHIDSRGGILASGDSSIFNYGRDYYCYVWPRDGSYAIWPLIRMGFKKEAIKFFEFCRDTMHRDGYLLHKYQPDRAIGSTWHPLVHNSKTELAIQEDETAIVIVMLGEYLDYTNDAEFVESLYSTLVQPAANFMAKFIDEATNLPHASYDLWEEKFLTTSYTTATVIRALRRASDLANMFGYPDDAVKWNQVADNIDASLKLLFDPESQSFRKGLLVLPDGNLQFDNTIDISSLYGILMFTNAKIDNTALRQTVSAVESTLLNNTIGGVIRYQNDNYMRVHNAEPNPWFVGTFWLAQYYVQAKKPQIAKQILDWSLTHTLQSGVMSEQIHPNSGMPVGVAPLVWSHAEFINTVLDVSGNQ